MNCSYTQPRLAAYLDRELRSDEAEAVRTHLHECSECEKEFAHLSALKSAIASLPHVQPQQDFESRLVDAVFAPHKGPNYGSRSNWRFALIPLGAVAAAYAVFSLTRGTPTSDERQALVSQNNNSLARDQAFDQARNPFSGGMTVSFDAPPGR